MSLEQLDRVLDGLEAEARRTAALRLRVIGEYERRGGHQRHGAITPADELARRHGRDHAVLRRDVTCAGKLRRLPLMAEALAGGSVTADHARELTLVLTPRTEAAMDRDEAMLVDLAAQLPHRQYRAALRHWKAHADPDGTDPGDHAPSEWTRASSIDGTLFTKGRFGTEDGETIKRVIDDLVDEMHRDGAHAPDTPIAQRRAAALVELARRGGATDRDGQPVRRTRPQLVVGMSLEKLTRDTGLGDLLGSDGRTLTASAIRRLACDADVVPAVLGTEGEVLDLGRRSRLVTPAQRLALTVRDRGCTFPGCQRPPDWCDAHHVHHWADGGPTDLDNLLLLCPRHHHLLHDRHWSVLRDAATGGWRFAPPDRSVRPPARRAPVDERHPAA